MNKLFTTIAVSATISIAQAYTNVSIPLNFSIQNSSVKNKLTFEVKGNKLTPGYESLDGNLSFNVGVVYHDYILPEPVKTLMVAVKSKNNIIGFLYFNTDFFDGYSFPQANIQSIYGAIWDDKTKEMVPDMSARYDTYCSVDEQGKKSYYFGDDNTRLVFNCGNTAARHEQHESTGFAYFSDAK